jgi:hypothetical protein
MGLSCSLCSDHESWHHTEFPLLFLLMNKTHATQSRWGGSSGIKTAAKQQNSLRSLHILIRENDWYCKRFFLEGMGHHTTNGIEIFELGPESEELHFFTYSLLFLLVSLSSLVDGGSEYKAW